MKKRYYIKRVNETYCVRIDSHDNRKRCMYTITHKTYGESCKAEAYALVEMLNSQLDAFEQEANYKRRWKKSSGIYLTV